MAVAKQLGTECTVAWCVWRDNVGVGKIGETGLGNGIRTEVKGELWRR